MSKLLVFLILGLAMTQALKGGKGKGKGGNNGGSGSDSLSMEERVDAILAAFANPDSCTNVVVITNTGFVPTDHLHVVDQDCVIFVNLDSREIAHDISFVSETTPDAISPYQTAGLALAFTVAYGTASATAILNNPGVAAGSFDPAVVNFETDKGFQDKSDSGSDTVVAVAGPTPFTVEVWPVDLPVDINIGEFGFTPMISVAEPGQNFLFANTADKAHDVEIVLMYDDIGSATGTLGTHTVLAGAEDNFNDNTAGFAYYTVNDPNVPFDGVTESDSASNNGGKGKGKGKRLAPRKGGKGKGKGKGGNKDDSEDTVVMDFADVTNTRALLIVDDGTSQDCALAGPNDLLDIDFDRTGVDMYFATSATVATTVSFHNIDVSRDYEVYSLYVYGGQAEFSFIVPHGQHVDLDITCVGPIFFGIRRYNQGTDTNKRDSEYFVSFIASGAEGVDLGDDASYGGRIAENDNKENNAENGEVNGEAQNNQENNGAVADKKEVSSEKVIFGAVAGIVGLVVVAAVVVLAIKRRSGEKETLIAKINKTYA